MKLVINGLNGRKRGNVIYTSLLARALKAVGELGRVDLKETLLKQLKHEDKQTRFWAAWSSVLLGDRGRALNILRLDVSENSAFCLPAMQVALPVLDMQSVKMALKILAENQETLRLAIIGAGISGDPIYIPWLIQQMQVPELAKVSGEAFSHLCGVDLAFQDMEGELPEGVAETGPTENPEDESVEMDDDEDLPCPNPVGVQQWWQDNQQSFKSEVRYLYGKPATVEQSQWVLKNGTQKLRYAAAIQLALAQPEQALFEVREFGKRQQQALE